MTVMDLQKELSRFRVTDEVMLHGGKLLVEAHRGSVLQESPEGEEMGRGVASEWVEIPVPSA